MNNLFNMLFGNKDYQYGDFEKNNYNVPTNYQAYNETQPQVQPLVVEEQTPQQKQALWDTIRGAMLGNVVDNSRVNDGMSATVNNPHYEGGIIPDLRSGFNENLNTRFEPNNLRNNGGGFVRRLGEAAGSIARIADSPLGRGVITYGLSNYIGDTNPLEQALTATMVNQRNRMSDKLYRDSLEEQGFDTSSIKGYINKDTYNNISLNNYRADQLLNYSVRNIIRMLNSGTISPEQAAAELQRLGYDYDNLNYSNQTINTKNKSKILPYQISNLGARTEYTKTKTEKLKTDPPKGEGKPDKKQNTKPIGVTKSGVKYKVVE